MPSNPSLPPIPAAAAVVRPFSNGSEMSCWLDANCRRCRKYVRESATDSCPMDRAIFRAYLGDGLIPSDLAVEYGATVDGEYCDMPAQCAHFDPIMQRERQADND